MKKYTLLFCLALFVQAAFSQKLYFARSNYTDSVAMAQNIPALAKQILRIKITAMATKNKHALSFINQEYHFKDIIMTLEISMKFQEFV